VLARPVVWTDDGVDWSGFAACVIRSTWDYHIRRDEFLGWARRVTTACQLWNPLPMLEWNSHKGYLLRLAQSGVPVVPTVLVQQGTRSLLADIVNDRSWGDCIVKPAVGAGAWQAGGPERLPELMLPSEEERSVAEAALRMISGPTLYARVDLVLDKFGSTRLLELELIEPFLFFSLAPFAAERLAEAIVKRVFI
jgi:hypothetical protein